MPYELAQIRMTKYCVGYEFGIDDTDSNPFFDDERDWVEPVKKADCNKLVERTPEDRFIVKSPYYVIELIPIGDVVDSPFVSGLDYLKSSGGSSDLQGCFESFVKEVESMLPATSEKSYGLNDLKPVELLIREISFIGLFNYWSDPGDMWEREPESGIEFIRRIKPDDLKLLAQ